MELSAILSSPSSSPRDESGYSRTTSAQSSYGLTSNEILLPLESLRMRSWLLGTLSALLKLIYYPQTQSVVIEPPPDITYASEDAAIASVDEWTKDHGFNVTKRRAFCTDPPTKLV
ncbi:unnamed protein product [Phytophthora lilii]|uniref:Unnamed protein product n=1 Tax=Phytophthora lilii TaxID=2077276 RepID=A0A9W6TMX3_9STRA|nr:unnamed protein product [Phytophthora lilii]